MYQIADDLNWETWWECLVQICFQFLVYTLKD